MTRLRRLASTSSLWTTGLAFLALTLAFAVWIRAWDLQILDQLADADAIRANLAAMSDAQKQAHWWMTLVLDYAYPLAYGCFFAGIALRFFGRWGLVLAIPALVSIPADMSENTTQLLMLKGNMSVIGLKTWLTPIKYWAFITAALIALTGLTVGLVGRFRRGRD